INPSQPPASTPVVVRLYKEDQQTIGSPTSLRVTSEGGSSPYLSSKHDVLAKSKDGANSDISAPKDSISQTTKQTKSTSEGLETVLIQPTTRKEASNIAQKIEEEFNTSPALSSSEDTKK
ncbi:hypothetical protein Tco_0495589, partial [Tanacetum coccineum]